MRAFKLHEPPPGTKQEPEQKLNVINDMGNFGQPQRRKATEKVPSKNRETRGFDNKLIKAKEAVK